MENPYQAPGFSEYNASDWSLARRALRAFAVVLTFITLITLSILWSQYQTIVSTKRQTTWEQVVSFFVDWQGSQITPPPTP